MTKEEKDAYLNKRVEEWIEKHSDDEDLMFTTVDAIRCYNDDRYGYGVFRMEDIDELQEALDMSTPDFVRRCMESGLETTAEYITWDGCGLSYSDDPTDLLHGSLQEELADVIAEDEYPDHKEVIEGIGDEELTAIMKWYESQPVEDGEPEPTDDEIFIAQCVLNRITSIHVSPYAWFKAIKAMYQNHGLQMNKDTLWTALKTCCGARLVFSESSGTMFIHEYYQNGTYLYDIKGAISVKRSKALGEYHVL